MPTDSTSYNIVACCWPTMLRSFAWALKIGPVSNYTQQVPTLLWFHANGRNVLGPTKLHAVGQQCCVRLHGPVVKTNRARGGGILTYSLGGGASLGSRKSYPLLDQILQIL